jgi:ABC-type sugar transport system substrate-binding protein
MARNRAERVDIEPADPEAFAAVIERAQAAKARVVAAQQRLDAERLAYNEAFWDAEGLYGKPKPHTPESDSFWRRWQSAGL